MSEDNNSISDSSITFRKEKPHQKILGTILKDVQTGVAAGLIATEPEKSNRIGFVTKDFHRPPPPKQVKTHLKCTHCGMSKHTMDQCFKLVGYPEWWNGCQKGGNKEGGKAVTTVGNSKDTSSSGEHQSSDTRSGGDRAGVKAGNELEYDGGTGFEELTSSSNPTLLNSIFFDPHVLDMLNNTLPKPTNYDTGQYIFKDLKDTSFFQNKNQSTQFYEINKKEDVVGSRTKEKPPGQVNMAKTNDNLDKSWILTVVPPIP
ncbi:hypothetical protein QVD17_07874 [Tagetes erecta]|uniref:Uncharacterized protein n=1 Tax=Tagetes erecta TaxID=13708 RepID=A0AAD8NX42_TARER|nr:hypothetical protein QVD17_07874 [Tagetes erecta]